MVLSSSTGDLRGGLTVSYANACCDESASRARRGAGMARVVGAGGLAAGGGAGTLAQAQSAAPAAKAPDSSLTWNGITLYGIVDVGVQYQTHGVPASDYFPAGTEAIILPNSNGSITAVTPNNLSQSRLGLSGKEPLAGDWSAVFRLEMFFNPQSGNISDALKSQVLNNGKALSAQGTNNTAAQLQLGVEGGGGSIDAYYAKKYDAIATAPLTAAQVAGLPALGYSPSNSLRATISDNTTYGVMGLFGLGAPTLFAGYEHIKFANPNSPLPVGSLTIGGYVIAVPNNAAYNNEKTLQVYWAGVKYAASSDVELVACY